MVKTDKMVKLDKIFRLRRGSEIRDCAPLTGWMCERYPILCAGSSRSSHEKFHSDQSSRFGVYSGQIDTHAQRILVFMYINTNSCLWHASRTCTHKHGKFTGRSCR